MLKKPLLISNSLIVTFQPKPDIRRSLNDFEKILCNDKTNFLSPTSTPVPDELFDPNIPRIVVETKHRFSQLTATQNMLSINTKYSPEYQQDFTICEQYITKHATVLFQLLKKIKKQPLFCGVASVVQIESKSTDESIIQNISDKYALGGNLKNLFDIDLKFTHVVEKKYYKNTRVQNYRGGEFTQNPFEIPRFASIKAHKRGIQVILEFNDRYMYNEKDSYLSSQRVCSSIIAQSFKHLNSEVIKLSE
jgi:hypothetical protein